MKVIETYLIELSLDEALKVKNLKDILVYNPIFDKFRVYEVGRSFKNMTHQISKALLPKLKFFVFKEEDVPIVYPHEKGERNEEKLEEK